jgi:hypothetical protein
LRDLFGRVADCLKIFGHLFPADIADASAACAIKQ